jgi:hypothetical protein
MTIGLSGSHNHHAASCELDANAIRIFLERELRIWAYLESGVVGESYRSRIRFRANPFNSRSVLAGSFQSFEDHGSYRNDKQYHNTGKGRDEPSPTACDRSAFDELAVSGHNSADAVDKPGAGAFDLFRRSRRQQAFKKLVHVVMISHGFSP